MPALGSKFETVPWVGEVKIVYCSVWLDAGLAELPRSCTVVGEPVLTAAKPGIAIGLRFTTAPFVTVSEIVWVS